jgi:protein-tyrosine phosphatase
MSNFDPGQHTVSPPIWTRAVPVSGIPNFRDYGNYRALDGSHIATGSLYRSAAPTHPTSADLTLIRALNLQVVIDLRGNAERNAAPVRLPARLAAQTIFADGERHPRVPHLEAASGADEATNIATARRNMRAIYARLPFRPLLVTIYSRYFRALAESPGPTLVHCAAGKDRTGLLVCLLHTVLGVHNDDMFHDYMLTNSVGDPEARVAQLRPHISAEFGSMSDAAIRVFASVEPAFLQSAFDAIGARYGSVASYLERVLGVTGGVRRALVARLLS